MFKLYNATDASRNPEVRPFDRHAGENNLRWLERALAELQATAQESALLLLGGDNRVSRRLRSAQARLRSDLAPSWWSHAALLTTASAGGDTRLLEISLEPAAGFGFPTPHNGIQSGRLERYRAHRVFRDADHDSHPNIALLLVPQDTASVQAQVEKLKLQRLQLDFPALVLRWLAWGWGAGSTDNPLLDGAGLPSSVMLEAAFAAAGFDLTPGLESRSCCPEAIWQSACWWQEYQQKRHANAQGLRGLYCATHSL